MHLLFENVTKSLLTIWEGKFKRDLISSGSLAGQMDGFIIPPGKWKEMAQEIAASNNLVPSRIARRVQDLNVRTYWNAESYMYFLLYLGPIVLKNRLNEQYYLHFLGLSEIFRTLTAVEIPLAELDQLEHGLARWVRDYERYVGNQPSISASMNIDPCRRLYYRYKISNLPYCTAPIHGLLHVVQYIRWQGPPAVYWCFSLERLVGQLKRETSNRKTPVAALGNRLLKKEQVNIECLYRPCLNLLILVTRPFYNLDISTDDRAPPQDTSSSTTLGARSQATRDMDG